MFGIVLRNSLENSRQIKFRNIHHALIHYLNFHTTSIKDNYRISVSHRHNNYINRCLVHPNITNRQFHIRIRVLSC